MSEELDELKESVEARIRVFPDWPKPGVTFRDIMPIMREPQLVNQLCKALAEYARHMNIEVVAALDARGFLFGPLIAIHLGVPFVPVRKAGKLPGPTIESSYTKEYGTDKVGIQECAIAKDQKVLIFDDVLATGGSMSAAVEVVRAAGGNVVQVIVLIELSELKGRERLDVDVYTFLTY